MSLINCFSVFFQSEQKSNIIARFKEIGQRYHIDSSLIDEVLTHKQQSRQEFAAMAQATLCYELYNSLPKSYHKRGFEEQMATLSCDSYLKLLTLIAAENSKRILLNSENVKIILQTTDPFFQLQSIFEKLLPENTLIQTHELAFV